MAKTWTEKFNSRKDTIVKDLDKNFADLKKGTSMLISTPKEIDAYVRNIKKGDSKTMLDMRHDLAKRHKADGTCPLTSGIFLRIVSEVATEKLNSGKSPDEITPFWRIVDPKSKLAKKLSIGTKFIEDMRENEGIV